MLEKAQQFSQAVNLTLHYLLGAQTASKALGKTLILNSHIILYQTWLVAQLKYVTLDLVHTQLCSKVDFVHAK